MTPPDTRVTNHRPIRELVCPDIEEPAPHDQVYVERRHSHRYSRRLPGEMMVAGEEHPITCVDIGYGGIGVVTPDPVQVAPGSQAAVTIELGGRSFRDDYRVVASRRAADGTAVHLRM